jgi:hypothetical protein
MTKNPVLQEAHKLTNWFVAAETEFGITSLAVAAPAPTPGDHLAISGLVTNPMGKGLKEVKVEVLVNGRHVKPTGKEAEVVTGKPGGYVADFILLDRLLKPG